MIGWRDRYHELRMVKGSGIDDNLCDTEEGRNITIVDVKERKLSETNQCVPPTSL